MIEERYCSYEVSKLLKEKGFKIGTNKDYWKIGEDGTMYFMSSIGAYTSNPNDEYAFYRPENSYPCPTHQMAMDWLREKGFYIEIQTLFDEFEPSLLKFTNFHALITTIIDGRVIDETHLADEGIRDYGECVENAINYCLTELIK